MEDVKIIYLCCCKRGVLLQKRAVVAQLEKLEFMCGRESVQAHFIASHSAYTLGLLYYE
jgi:hypothetical protein